MSGRVTARVWRWSIVALAGLALVVGGLVPVAGSNRVIDVATQAELLAAIDTSQPGDLILVAPGTYDGGIVVPAGKDGITIRGLNRNTVVFDGRRGPNAPRDIAIKVGANDVTLENMTAHSFTQHGFYWRSVQNYAGRYLTAYNNRLYGIYAFDSRVGVFEHSYASGSGDASFYIGQCHPCDAVINNVVAERSALGYSGTNAGGNLTIKDSLWRNNGTGILPNSLDGQADPPQRETTIVNNTVEGSGSLPTPGAGLAAAAVGHGIGVAGGVGNDIQGNTVTGNTKYGIVLFLLPDQNIYLPYDNKVVGNTVSNSGLADLAVAAGSGTGNCFSQNTHGSSAPAAIESLMPCSGPGLNSVEGNGDPVVAAVLAAEYGATSAGLLPRPDYLTMPVPGPQQTMPNPDPRP